LSDHAHRKVFGKRASRGENQENVPCKSSGLRCAEIPREAGGRAGELIGLFRIWLMEIMRGVCLFAQPRESLAARGEAATAAQEDGRECLSRMRRNAWRTMQSAQFAAVNEGDMLTTQMRFC